MVGSACIRRLAARGLRNPHRGADAQPDPSDRRRSLDGRKQPEVVIIAAAKVGGILANDSSRRNSSPKISMIEPNVIDAAHRNGVGKLLFLGSTCIYPRIGAAAYAGGGAADRTAGKNQRMVCDRQDRRHQTVPSLSQTIWRRFHFGHAHAISTVRTTISIQPPAMSYRPCSGAFTRTKRMGRQRSSVGARAHRGENSFSSTTSPTPAFSY